jgi:8-oxo-dGTP pyrophosphatase MutT (NUDIX family)
MSGSSPEGDDLPDWLLPVASLAESEPHSDVFRLLRPPLDAAPRAAAVLVLLGEGAAGPEVLLIERSHDMRSHAGQIAFPGGAQDPDDADEIAAALREANEETGLDSSGVQVIGTLPLLWLAHTNFAVTPVLAWWRTPSPVHAVDAAETASVHTVPISELADPANRASVTSPGGLVTPAFLVRGLVVWGFTALILSTLLELAGWSLPWDDSRMVDLPTPLVASSLRDHERAEIEP